MRVSYETIQILADGGCKNAERAKAAWLSLAPHADLPVIVEAHFHLHSNMIEVSLAWENGPKYKRTVMGMPAVKVA